MTSPIWFYSAPLRETFGLDASLYLVTAIVERREDAALSAEDVATVRAALTPHSAPPSSAPPAPSAEARFVDVDMRGPFGLDGDRFQVTARIGRRDRQPLTDTDTATIRAALASESIAAE